MKHDQKHDHLKRFVTLDRESFTAMGKQFGLTALACYRIKNDKLSLVIAADAPAEINWPVVVTFTDDYTPENLPSASFALPFGWFKPKVPRDHRGLWPKNLTFYYPAQDLWHTKLVFAVIDPPGRRRTPFDLDGGLEAASRRIGFWLDQAEMTHFVSEASFREHLHGLAVDLQKMIDHEIRTPLASIAGFASMLGTLAQESGSAAPREWEEYRRVIEVQSGHAIDAVTKLSLSLQAASNDLGSPDQGRALSMQDLVRAQCERLRREAPELVGEEAATKLHVVLRILTDETCLVRGVQDLIGWSLWEVLKNALIYGRSGEVTVTLYRSDQMAVIDVEDDGPGVSSGAEDLIFLRFYQDPGGQPNRRGKRGLGLGLFLARYLAEQHFGVLSYVRTKVKGGVFRFIFPLVTAEEEAGNSPIGKSA